MLTLALVQFLFLAALPSAPTVVAVGEPQWTADEQDGPQSTSLSGRIRRRVAMSRVSPPVVTTSEVWGITGFWAFAAGAVVSDGGSPVTSRGVCWSTASEPTIADDKTDGGPGAGSFTSCMPDLEAGTAYTVRAYAMNAVGIGYGTPVAFTTRTPDPRHEYMGQTPPGGQFVQFAPGIVPEAMYHSVTVSPDGKEIYWAALTGGGRTRLTVTRLSNGRWTAPEPVQFAGRPSGEFWDDAPVVSPDSRELFFTSYRPFGSSGARWWYMVAERTPTGWSAAAPLPEVISARYGGHWGVTISASGTVYFEFYSGGNDRIFFSRMVNGHYTAPVPVRFAGGAEGEWYAVCPFVAPDESYLIFNRVERGVPVGYYVSFRGSAGEWLAPVRLATFPSPSWESTFVTRDGKHVFCKNYWASAEIIEDLRSSARE